MKLSLLAAMKLGSIQYFLGGLNRNLGPERGDYWRREAELREGVKENLR